MYINVIQYLESTAALYPNKISVSEQHRSVTFAELKQAAVGVAGRIHTITQEINRPIAVLLPKSIEAVASFAGILFSGNLYVPLDAKAPVERLRAVLSNLSPACVITNRKLLPNLLAAGFSVDLTVVLEDNISHLISAKTPEAAIRHQRIIDTDPVYIIYTSGSTGLPKGVTIPHRGVIDYIEWANSVYDVDAKDIIGSQAPFFFDNSTLDIYLCFSRGATLHLIPEEKFAFPIQLVEHLRASGVTTIFWVPSLMTTIANYDIFGSLRPELLNKILFAGEVMPAKTLNYWRKHFPAALFSNLYGPTEITVDCTFYLVDRTIQDHEPVPIGFPCRNSDVLILNDRNEQCAKGEIGELCVRGSSLALGYWNAPDKTEAAFVQNPLRAQYPERIYKTGDLVQQNQFGEIIFLGRKDSQIKHQGYRIELGEIEAAAGLVEDIRAACVIYNQKNQEIILFYEAKQEIPARDLREKLARRLPRYMIPSVLKWLKTMPLNANGKIDRTTISQTIK